MITGLQRSIRSMPLLVGRGRDSLTSTVPAPNKFGHLSNAKIPQVADAQMSDLWYNVGEIGPEEKEVV